MKALRILVLFLLIGGLNFAARAQACCPFSIKIRVLDKAEKPITNAKVFLSSEVYIDTEFDFDYGAGAYKSHGLIGVGTRGTANIKVSADGYETFEKEIYFGCGNQSFVLKPKPKKSKNPAEFEELAYVQGMINDSNGAPVSGARVILKGENFQTEDVTEVSGYFSLTEIPNGLYTLEINTGDRYAPFKVEKFNISKGTLLLNPVLEKNSAAKEIVCTQDENYKNIMHCQLAVKN